MKTITITTEEYDKLKADVKAADMIIAQLLGTLQAITERVSLTPAVLRGIQKVLDNTQVYFAGVGK
jgi:predicted RNA methylase